MLHAEHTRIIDDHDREVTLRGVCVGGWMNLENFLNGNPDDPQAREATEQPAHAIVRHVGDNALDVHTVRHLAAQAALSCFTANMLQPYFAQCFAALSVEEIDQVLQSLALRNCRLQNDIIAVLERHWRKQPV